MSAPFAQSKPPRTHQPLCPVCNSTELRTARPGNVADRSVLACAICEMIFVWPRLEQDFSLLPESHYYDDWRSLNFDTLKGLFSDVIATRRRVAQLTANTESPSILEVGCGSGHALTHFRAHGWRVRGIDPWRSVTEAGRKYYGLTIETGRIDATNTIAPESQDIVMAIDVLQFTAEPRHFLRACFTTLKSGGMLYLTVPNFDSAASRREGWDWHYFIPRSYLSYFTKSTLTRLAELVGFRNVNMSAFGGREGDSFLRLGACRPAELTWAELGEEVPDTDLPPLDRRTLPHKRLTPEQCSWRENGYIIIPRFFPNDLIERYCAVRAQLDSVGGWPSPTAYLEVKEIRDLCLYGKLSGMLEHLLGEPMALHLTLTGWVSTERAWHQDDYLNPPTVNGHYAAVWTALDEIKPDCGPFEFVPGSHRWPFIRQANVLSLLGRKDNEDPNWPWDSERLLTPFFQSEIAQRGSKVERFLGGKGDILIWHPRLVHRGGMAERPGAERKAIITHYSAVSRRSDMPVTRRHPGGGLYFVPGTQLTNTRATVQKLLGRLRARLHRPS